MASYAQEIEQTVTAEIMNHRTRVGIERRQKMRMRLIESALLVFAEKGVDASVIDDVIVAAEVSRGTFYNYFRTTAELLAAVGELLGNEMMVLIEGVVGDLENPVERLASGLRIFLHTARTYPHFASFIWRAGFNAASAGHLVYVYLPRHIGESMARGSFHVATAEVALDVIAGVTLVAIFGLSTRTVAVDYPEQMVLHMMLALGLPRQEADRLMSLPLPAITLPAGSLLVRAHG